MEWVSSRTLFEPSGSKDVGTMTFIHFWCLYCGNYISIAGTPTLRSFIHVDVGEPTRHPCSMTRMMQDHHLLQLGVTWDIYLRELLCHREEVLSGMRIYFSESVVFHRVFWVSFLLVFFVWLCLFGFVLFRLWKTPGFLLFTCSRTMRIADQKQNALMTVRASSVHGMSSKKRSSDDRLTKRGVLSHSAISSQLVHL